MPTFRELNLPQEIYDLIKIRCEEQGSVFNVDKPSNRNTSEGGFYWQDSVEGMDFWDSILGMQYNTKKGIEDFFKRYPKNKVELISEEPRIYKASFKGKKYEITIKEINDAD